MYKIISICKGGGYMYCRTIPIHLRANDKGLYPLHRVLIENKLGRDLLTTEHVHHIDENKSNNEIDNLKVLTASEHGKLHSKHVDMIELICPVCNKHFSEMPHYYRVRLRRNKSGIYCSKRCGTIGFNIARSTGVVPAQSHKL